MKTITFDNLIDKKGKVITVEVPDDYKLDTLKEIQARASASGARFKAISEQCGD